MFGLGRIDKHIGFKRLFIGAIVFIWMLLWGSYGYQQLISGTDQAILEKLSQRHERVEVAYYTVENQRIRYADIGYEQSPMLILFHGAPGGISTWYNLIKNTQLTNTYRIILIDRPGYGKSGSRAVTSLIDQARFSKPLLDLNKHSTKPILIGHSLAPPILAKMAVLYPDDIGGLIMISGAMVAEHEIVWRASYPLHTKLTKRLVPPSLRSTNAEKLTHKAELRVLQTDRKSITHHITLMHGPKDRIVPIENSYVIEQRATQAQLDVRIHPDRDHFLPFDRAGTIEKAVEDMGKAIKNSGRDV